MTGKLPRAKIIDKAAYFTTSEKRARFPRRYAKKDARTQVLRIVYGPQSNRDNTIQWREEKISHLTDFQATKNNLIHLLGLTNWPAEKQAEILGDFFQLHAQASPSVVA